VARLRGLLSSWRFYIVIAYLALAVMTLSLYRSVQVSGDADRTQIQSNAAQHLVNCHQVENVKEGIRLFLREIEKLNRALDGPEAEARARVYEQFIERYFSVALCPRREYPA